MISCSARRPAPGGPAQYPIVSNKPFLLLTASMLCTAIGSQMVGPMGNSIIIHAMYGGDIRAGSELSALAANAGTIATLICIPVMTHLSRRVGKVTVLRSLILLGIAASASKVFTYNREYPSLVMVTAILMAPTVAGYWTITASMKADVCDDDELNHGLRREGVFGAVGSWVSKAGLAATYLLSGVVLELSGFHVSLGGEQAPHTLLWMRILFAVIPLFFSVAALYFLHTYPLDENRMASIRNTLESRRAPVS